MTTEASSGGFVEHYGEHNGLLRRDAVIRQMERVSHPADSQEWRLFETLETRTTVLDAQHSGHNV